MRRKVNGYIGNDLGDEGQDQGLTLGLPGLTDRNEFCVLFDFNNLNSKWSNYLSSEWYPTV